ncbi:MAG: hypothetical protein FWG26_09690 [Betaproteobacteria bacterium]|nr:hypothetical protein [Betaproteobacteria bacterium]
MPESSPACGSAEAADADIEKPYPSENAIAMTPTNRRIQYLWGSEVLMM